MSKRNNGGFILDLLFPKRCPWCGKVIGFSDHLECDAAREKLRLPAEEIIDRAEITKDLDRLYACFRYEKPVSDAIVRFKIYREEELANSFGPALVEKFTDEGLGEHYDLLIPVPVSPKTFRKRGYNQSALLAACIAAEREIPLETGWLLKTRETQRQMTLAREERLTNVLGAYGLAPDADLTGKRVLLVDDVLTTGATAGECARTLREAGASACGLLCLASA